MSYPQPRETRNYQIEILSAAYGYDKWVRFRLRTKFNAPCLSQGCTVDALHPAFLWHKPFLLLLDPSQATFSLLHCTVLLWFTHWLPLPLPYPHSSAYSNIQTWLCFGHPRNYTCQGHNELVWVLISGAISAAFAWKVFFVLLFWCYSPPCF